MYPQGRAHALRIVHVQHARSVQTFIYIITIITQVANATNAVANVDDYSIITNRHTAQNTITKANISDYNFNEKMYSA